MPEVAATHFGFRCTARAAVVVADGLALIDHLAAALRALPPPPAPADTTAHAAAAAAAAPGAADGGVSVPPVAALPALPLDLLYVDADSKDPSLGLSAPPKVLLTPPQPLFILPSFYIPSPRPLVPPPLLPPISVYRSLTPLHHHHLSIA